MKYLDHLKLFVLSFLKFRKVYFAGAFLLSLLTFSIDIKAQTAYNVPAGVTQIQVETWGGGGGGGSVNSNAKGSGGGGGGYSKKLITVTQSIYYYNIGTGGAANSAGGDSWFSTSNSASNAIVLARGGGGGTSNGAGGSGGALGTGDVRYSGGGGGTTTSGSSRSGQGGASAGISSNGTAGGIANGTVTASIGGAPGVNGRNSNGVGTDGVSPGGGGSGAFRSSGTSTYSGGAGGDGMVVITPIYPATGTGLWGSGSRDLFPVGLAGRRASLMSAAQGFYPSAYQFINLGVQKVYAKVGEKLYLGSSAQGRGSGRIRVYKPSNTSRTAASADATSANDGVGRIGAENNSTDNATFNRLQERIGPNINGTRPGGYTPFVVNVDEEGIWEIHFIAPNGDSYNNSGVPSGYHEVLVSNESWIQNESTSAITAWDVTVANGNTPVPGRVYQNVFNTWSANNTTAGNGFYGKFYVLTEDGYPYLVDNNGMQGIAFTFFVNNRGFTTAANGSGVRTYKSLNYSTNPPVKNPNEVDDPVGPNQNITHKIFYGKPAKMPKKAIYKADSVWLRTLPPEAPKATAVTFEGIEGNEGYASSKGGYIKFESNIGGTYRLTIPGGTSSGGVTYYPRVLVGPSVAGQNSVVWDGKSGTQANPLVAGSPMPPGSTISSLKVQVFGAEVHFPFLDVEVNPNGIIIQQLDTVNYEPWVKYGLDGNRIDDVVYWDDSNVTLTANSSPSSAANPSANVPTTTGVGLGTAGVRSSIDGHSWGLGGGTNGYGNERSIDTYSFVAGAETEEGISVTIREANLEVSSIVSNITTSTPVNIGDSWNYTVVVKNSGPTAIVTNNDPLAGLITAPAKFRLYVPKGITIDPTQVTFNSGNGVAIVGTPTFTPSVDNTTGGIFEAQLNMPVGGIATFTLPVSATGVISQTGNGDVNTYATILRPADFTDPDATNQLSIAPTDPFFEASGINTAFSTAIYTNPSGVVLTSTNNIKRHSLPTMKADLKITKIGKQSSINGGAGVGSFTITVENLGTSIATGVVVTDVLAARYAYDSSSASLGSVDYTGKTITWTVGTIPVNGSETLTFNTINTSSSDKANTATVTGEQYDPVSGNNTSTITFAGGGDVVSPTTDLQVVKLVNGASTASVLVGSVVTFTVTVKKVLPAGTNVNNVIVKDLLPAGFTLTGTPVASQGTYNSSTGVWTVGAINSSADRTLTITAVVKPSTGTPNEYTNVATITSTDNLDDDASNNTSQAIVTVGSMLITNPMIYQRIKNE